MGKVDWNYNMEATQFQAEEIDFDLANKKSLKFSAAE